MKENTTPKLTEQRVRKIAREEILKREIEKIERIAKTDILANQILNKKS